MGRVKHAGTAAAKTWNEAVDNTLGMTASEQVSTLASPPCEARRGGSREAADGVVRFRSRMDGEFGAIVDAPPPLPLLPAAREGGDPHNISAAHDHQIAE
ncbi:MAG: hypothetical protein FJX57_05255 [Alphaproteobacteria bacterium]|nr:hypothetical protein [Alphaproteobacteria bacterium]